jgi:hypothetical protein
LPAGSPTTFLARPTTTRSTRATRTRLIGPHRGRSQRLERRRHTTISASVVTSKAWRTVARTLLLLRRWAVVSSTGRPGGLRLLRACWLLPKRTRRAKLLAKTWVSAHIVGMMFVVAF